MSKKAYWSIMLFLGLGLGSCNIDTPVETVSSFETMTIQKKDVDIPFKFSARMKGQNDVTITPQVSGQLMKICVTEGEQVRAGQTLFIIDSSNARNDLQSCQASVQAAQANLLSAQARENSAKLEYESNKNLFEQKIVSNYTLENSLNAYKQAQAAVAQAKAAVSQANASVSQARVNLGRCTITAPVTGVIGSINVRTGDQVSPLTQLTIVSGNTTMNAEFSVTESIIEEMVQEGMTSDDVKSLLANLPEATFIMKNGTEYSHKGHVTSLTGMVNSSTGSLTCKVAFPNPEGLLFSGIQGTVVMSYTQKNAMVVPQSSVVRLQDKSLVYKVKADSTATAVDVTTEDMGNGKDFIITSGLKVGERIVTIGANNVVEGQKVLFPEEKKK